jgi:hypothetical protein
LKQEKPEKSVEESIVIVANTTIEPVAVMIEVHGAPVTLSTMFG